MPGAGAAETGRSFFDRIDQRRDLPGAEIACAIVDDISQRARAFREKARHDDAYDVPYSTPHVGIIRGGTALNIVPRDCWFDFEIRHLPFDDPLDFFADVQAFAATFVPKMHSIDPQTYIEFDTLSASPGFDTHDDCEIIAIGKACNGTHDFHKVSFASEAALFHAAEIPSVLCGPDSELTPGCCRAGAGDRRPA